MKPWIICIIPIKEHYKKNWTTIPITQFNLLYAWFHIPFLNINIFNLLALLKGWQISASISSLVSSFACNRSWLHIFSYYGQWVQCETIILCWLTFVITNIMINFVCQSNDIELWLVDVSLFDFPSILGYLPIYKT